MNWDASQAGEGPAFRPLKLDWRFELGLALSGVHHVPDSSKAATAATGHCSRLPNLIGRMPKHSPVRQ